jgi:hypothetical protein
MLLSQPFMFCPECQAEYLPHVRLCSDCRVPLVENLPARYSHSKRKRRSGFIVFKEWGLFIVLPILFLAPMLAIIAIGHNSFGIQIASAIGYSLSAFLFLFCDMKWRKGYNLGEKAVRQKLPLLLCIHAGFLVLIFAGVAVAILVWSHLSPFWTLPRGGSGKYSNTPPFVFILVLIGLAILFAQIFISRGILGRGLEDQQRCDGS